MKYVAGCLVSAIFGALLVIGLNAAEEGLSIHDLAPSRVKKDLESWDALSQWLERRLSTPLNGRDHYRPDVTSQQLVRRLIATTS